MEIKKEIETSVQHDIVPKEYTQNEFYAPLKTRSLFLIYIKFECNIPRRTVHLN